MSYIGCLRVVNILTVILSLKFESMKDLDLKSKFDIFLLMKKFYKNKSRKYLINLSWQSSKCEKLKEKLWEKLKEKLWEKLNIMTGISEDSEPSKSWWHEFKYEWFF